MTQLQTSLWHEEPEPQDPFQARVARVAGYDVYGSLLGRVTPQVMQLMLLTGDAPTSQQEALLNDLSVALANPGPRDPSVTAAMAAAVGIPTPGAVLMAALAAGSGQGGGGRDVRLAMERWVRCGQDLDAWARDLADPPVEPVDVWPEMDHIPGFEPHSVHCALPTQQTLTALAKIGAPSLVWLAGNQQRLESLTRSSLSLAGVAAAAYADLGLDPVRGEILHLMLRLPGAAAHAVEQAELGFKNFPYPGVRLLNDPENPASAEEAPATTEVTA